MSQPESSTPLMRQYLDIKHRHQDALVFFRLGDFYELFFEDAKTASRILNITLTSRNKNSAHSVPMCGVPHHSSHHYISKLIQAGHKVAICEQLEEVSEAKDLVKRDVVRILSPGTHFDLESFNAKSSIFTHAALPTQSRKVFWATADYTTGYLRFGVSNNTDDWIELCLSQGLSEILLPDEESSQSSFEAIKKVSPKTFVHTVPAFYFDLSYAHSRIQEQFNVSHLTAVHAKLEYIQATPVGALIKYFQETQRTNQIPNCNKIEWWNQDHTMDLDLNTIRTLELLPQTQASSRDVSLCTLLDRTQTAMGGRLLKQWIIRPLTCVDSIQSRLNCVEESLHLNCFDQIKNILSEIYDLERLMTRITIAAKNTHSATANARDLRALAHSIIQGQKLCQQLSQTQHLSPILRDTLSENLFQLATKCLNAITDLPPASIKETGMFKLGYSADLDEFIKLTSSGTQWIAALEAKERTQTMISSLKVRFNKVFGYYIEVTKANLNLVPSHYIRKQTMVGGERYITKELKTFEEKIFTAEKKRQDLEFLLFLDLCTQFSEQSAAVTLLSQAIAKTDVFFSLGQVAKDFEYTRPQIDQSCDLEITASKHPVVSLLLSQEPKQKAFVPNSVVFDQQKRFLLITGPNMGGKSTVMRQTGLICLMAQMGSFVPAQKARIGVIDRIFTRIGANDNIAEGRSTFLVEMNEMSFILRNATHRSLILLDEIGRGTSTYDGLSLAWALATDIAKRIQARTLFATHYHELTALAECVDSVANFRVAVATEKDAHGHYSVQFLYRLEPGASEKSYGILVARLAGIPDPVLKHAEELLNKLENNPKEKAQLSFTFQSRAKDATRFVLPS